MTLLRSLVLLSLVFCSSCTLFDFSRGNTLVIAFVGDSVTHWENGRLGVALEECYPKRVEAALKRLLHQYGTDVQALLFAKAGGQVCNITEMDSKMIGTPYISSSKYRQLMSSQPHVIVSMLGNSDARSGYWHEHCFRRSYEALLKSFAALPSSPLVLVATNTPNYTPSKKYNQKVANTVLPDLVADIAQRGGYPLVDVFGAMGGRWLTRPELFMEDLIHPSPMGHEVMAEVVTARLIYLYLGNATSRPLQLDIN